MLLNSVLIYCCSKNVIYKSSKYSLISLFISSDFRFFALKVGISIPSIVVVSSVCVTYLFKCVDINESYICDIVLLDFLSL